MQDYKYFEKRYFDTLGMAIRYEELLLKPDDIISITVSALDPVTVAPFNLGKNANGAVDPASNTYLIATDGSIEYPIIGSIKIAGLTRLQATTLLKSRISEYVKNPIVSLKLMNFKVTILGDVRQPGVFNLSNERVTLTEALGMAGDINVLAKRTNVLVLREEGGQKVETRVNMTTDSLFYSPVYYLKQNDLIYVEPIAPSNPRNTDTRLALMTVISGVSIVVGVLSIFRRN